MRNLIATLAGLVVAGTVALTAAPAAAADTRCEAMPQQVRSALAGAEPAVAQNAARRLRTGEALCRANNQRAAAKEFQVALKLLGANGAGTTLAGQVNLILPIADGEGDRRSRWRGRRRSRGRALVHHPSELSPSPCVAWGGKIPSQSGSGARRALSALATACYRRPMLAAIAPFLRPACWRSPPASTALAPVAPAARKVGRARSKPVRVSGRDRRFLPRARQPAALGRPGAGPRPEALRLAGEIARAADHGLDPERYGAAELAAALEAAGSGDAAARARAELLLSRAYPAFVRDLRVPAGGGRGVTWVDAELAPEPPEARALLEAAAAAPDLGRHLAEATAINPLYAALSRGYARRRAAAPRLPPAEEAVIRANLDRARLIPALPGRYVIVDAGSARLWMIDGDRVDGPMRVIVGKPNMQTPAMAGLIRYVTLNPWWNVPPDLARERARRVLKSGPGFLQRERIELLSDWSDRPRVISGRRR